MKLTFLGTRGNIRIRSIFHHMHSALRVSYQRKSVLIDCGEDWLDRRGEINPNAIVLTHGHPDHAWGLKGGAPCPVYATEATCGEVRAFRIEDLRVIKPREPIRIFGMEFEAFPLVHSIRSPAVGYRVSAGRASIFYAPDVVAIEDRTAALSGVKLYVGDGATILRSMVRKSGEALVGHTPIRTQIGWCHKEGVPRAVFTHCGTEIVSGKGTEVQARVQALGQAQDVFAEIAHDGMEIVL